jgi:hypothetical protein
VILGVGGGACLLTGGAGCVMTGPIEGNVSFTDPLLGAATGGSAIEDATGNSVTTGYSTAGSYAFVNLSTAGQLAQLKLGNNGGLGGILFAARGDQIEIGAGGIELFASGSDTITVAGPLDLPSELIDSTGSGGTPGQLLSSIAGTPPKTRWITPPIRTCQTGLGDGLNAIPSGTYPQTFCYNDSGVTWTIVGIKCFTDNAGSSTLTATDNSANALLTGAITCSSSFAAGTQSAHVTIASGGYIKFSFAADGTSTQTAWVVSITQ